MKTLKYIILGVILSSLLLSSFSFSPSRKRVSQEERVTFCETYTQQEIFSKLEATGAFFSWLHVEGTDPAGSRIGTCDEADLSAFWNYIQSEAFRSKVPGELIIAAGAGAPGSRIPLYAIRKPAPNDLFPSRQDIGAVSVHLDNDDNYALLISFSDSGATKWATLTRKNIGRDIAILLDGRVIAAPRVREEIKGGKCSISGNYTEDEINKLKSVFEE
jgi:SecD/SecF fusion protein